MVVDVDVHVGERIRRRRRHLEMTQERLAGRIGVRFQQIHKYECGASQLSVVRLWKLATALGVPVAYFFEGLEQASGPAPRVEDPSGDPAQELRALHYLLTNHTLGEIEAISRLLREGAGETQTPPSTVSFRR